MPKSPVVESLGGRLKQSLAALKAGQESLGQFAEGLFNDFAQLHQHVQEAEKNLCRQRKLLEQERHEFEATQAKRTATDSGLEQRLQAQLEEIDQDRKALEEELALVRAEAANMAAKIAEQKQQLADEHAEWADELKQLRRILDTQRTPVGGRAETPAPPAPKPQPPPRTPAAAAAPPSKSTGGPPSVPTGSANMLRAGSNRSRIIPAGVVGDGSVAVT